MRASVALLCVALLVCGTLGCGRPYCTPGKTESCACPRTTTTGVQTCAYDGSRYGACTGCPSGTGGGAGGSGGSGSSGGGSEGDPCDVLQQDCTGVYACVFPSIGPGDSKCRSPGGSAVGESCPASATSTSCQKGLQCLASTCKKICNLDGGLPACMTGACRPEIGFSQNAGTCS